MSRVGIEREAMLDLFIVRHLGWRRMGPTTFGAGRSVDGHESVASRT